MSLGKTVSRLSIDTVREGTRKISFLFPKSPEEIPRKESVNTSNRLNILETKTDVVVWQTRDSLMVILILPQCVLT